MIAGLRGDNRLLDTGQKPLRLGQRQSQIGDTSEARGPIDLYQVNTLRRAVGPGFDQSQNPSHESDPPVTSDPAHGIISLPSPSPQTLDSPLRAERAAGRPGLVELLEDSRFGRLSGVQF